MLNETQLNIANAIFIFIKEKDNSVSKYELHKHLVAIEFNKKEISTTIAFLELHYKLIETYKSKLISFEIENYRITPEGNKAIKIGIVKYIARKEKENKKSKTPIVISIIALFIAAIQPGISLYKLVCPENETENSNYQGKNGCYYTDSIIKQVLTDTTFVEKLKDSIIHDTEFLNQLKFELKRKTTDKLKQK